MDVRSGGENMRRKTGPSEIRTAGKAKGPKTHVWAPVGASGWAIAIVRHGPVVVIHARHGALRLTNPNFITSRQVQNQTARLPVDFIWLCAAARKTDRTERNEGTLSAGRSRGRRTSSQHNELRRRSAPWGSLIPSRSSTRGR